MMDAIQTAQGGTLESMVASWNVGREQAATFSHHNLLHRRGAFAREFGGKKKKR